MKRLICMVLMGGLLAGCDSSSPSNDVPRLSSGQQQTILESLSTQARHAYRAINVVRLENGAGSLELNRKLCTLARRQSIHMMHRQRITNEGPIGEAIDSRLNLEKVDWNYTAQMIGRVDDSVSAGRNMVQDWLEGPHRHMLLDETYTQAGIAAAQNPSTGKWYLTLIMTRKGMLYR